MWRVISDGCWGFREWVWRFFSLINFQIWTTTTFTTYWLPCNQQLVLSIHRQSRPKRRKSDYKPRIKMIPLQLCRVLLFCFEPYMIGSLPSASICVWTFLNLIIIFNSIFINQISYYSSMKPLFVRNIIKIIFILNTIYFLPLIFFIWFIQIDKNLNHKEKHKNRKLLITVW